MHRYWKKSKQQSFTSKVKVSKNILFFLWKKKLWIEDKKHLEGYGICIFFRHWQTELVHTSMNTKHFSGEFAFLLLVADRKSCSSKFLPFFSLLSAFMYQYIFSVFSCFIITCVWCTCFSFHAELQHDLFVAFGFFFCLDFYMKRVGEEWKGKESVPPTKNATHVAFQIWHYSYYYWCCISNKMDSECMKTCRCRL